MRNEISVLVVDDSSIDRELLTAIIQATPGMTLAGVAANAYDARDKAMRLRFDVVLLDVLMPGMDGLRFLRYLMRKQPVPVIMCSAVTAVGAHQTIEALRCGAVDFIQKHSSSGRELGEFGAQLRAKIFAAAGTRANAHAPDERLHARPSRARAGDDPSCRPPERRPANSRQVVPQRREGASHTQRELVAIGASTGGVAALESLLQGLDARRIPPLVVALHIPEGFSRSLAERLDQLLPLSIREAQDGMPLVAGQVLVAPGGRQFTVQRSDAGLFCRVRPAASVDRHCPSVDVLFRSVAEAVGPGAVGIMLTGMGADGAAGMAAMREAGAHNIAQDEATSLVWGMPAAAIDAGAIHEVLPLSRIAPALLRMALHGRRDAGESPAIVASR